MRGKVIDLVMLLLGVFFGTFVKEAMGSLRGTTVRKNKPVCRTEACVNRAKYLLHMMDPRVNPCDDFYKFTCGKFMRDVEIPEDKNDAHIVNWMTEYSQSQLVSLLMAAPLADEFQAHSKAKTLYKLCMDEAAMDRRGVSPLLEKLKAAGGWPVLGNWNGDNWNFLDTQLRLKDLGFKGNSFFHLYVYVNTFDDSPPRIMLEGPDMTSGLGIGEGSPDVQNHYEYMVESAVLLGADRQTAEEQLAEVLSFEKQLSEFSQNSEYNYTTMDLETLSEEADWLDWPKLLKKSMGVSINMSKNENITVLYPEYIKNLGGLLKKHSNEVVANYMLWGAVDQMADKLTSQMRALKPQEKPRWEECYEFVSVRLPIALSSLFVTTFKDTKKEVEKMAERLRQELLRKFLEVEWLDDETRLHVQGKLVRMGKDIAYPKELMDKKVMDSYYEKLSINKDHFFEAVLDMEKWHKEVDSSLLRENKKYDWQDMGEMSRWVNAFFNPEKNYIGIPAGIIHNPFYDPGVPAYANYGALGVVIGHEMVHSFDNNGIYYDAEGKVKNSWRNETLEIFTEKKQCIVDQYGNFTDLQTNSSLNGENTQGENIADNGGFKMAYRTYKRLVGNQAEPSLPGLQQYTSDQLFMISFAAPWCSKMDTETLKMVLKYDPHSPGHFRVLGVAMNSPDFSKAFHCKKGDRMNPSDKCNVW